jgi:hypothetical protein
MHATCPAHLILPDLITLIVCGEMGRKIQKESEKEGQ